MRKPPIGSVLEMVNLEGKTWIVAIEDATLARVARVHTNVEERIGIQEIPDSATVFIANFVPAKRAGVTLAFECVIVIDERMRWARG